MKVLFALSDDEVSEQIVKRYRKEYKEIISYKNVYYFNAIVKEIQKDKNYDRIVISEDLEQSVTNNINQMDKVIFEKLDAITDEATDAKGKEIPIVFICSNYRKKSDYFAVKLFSLGIYNALIGNDREISEVCQLLKKPRVKKDAKIYYKIDSEESIYQSESENDVNETEIQNILAHYKKIGNDEKKCIESFDDIAEQYNDQQLKLIVKCLPLGVRAILEEKSDRYKEIVLESPSLKLSNSDVMRVKETGLSRGFKNVQSLLGNKEEGVKKEVIIPTNINLKNVKKITDLQPKPKNEIPYVEEENIAEEIPFVEEENVTEGIPYAEEENIAEEIPFVEEENTAEGIPYAEEENVAEGIPYAEEENVAEEIPYAEEENIAEVIPYAEEENTAEEIPYAEEQNAAEEIQQENEEMIDLSSKELEQPKKEKKTKNKKEKKVEESDEVIDFTAEEPEIPDIESEEVFDFTFEDQQLPEIKPEEILDFTFEEPEIPEIKPEEIPDFTFEEPEIQPEEVIDFTAEGPEDAEEAQEEEVIDFTAEELEDVEEAQEEEVVDFTAEGPEDVEEAQEEEVIDFTTEEPEDVEEEPEEKEENQEPQEMHFIEEDEIISGLKKNTKLQSEEHTSKYDKSRNKLFGKTTEPTIGLKEDNVQEELKNQNEEIEEPVKEIVENNTELPIKEHKHEPLKNIKGLSEYDEIYSSGKKLVAFVGSRRVGTSFLINNLAELIQSKGINTAILDLTKNRNSYYIYTKGDEDLRNIAMNTKDYLLTDRNAGIKVRRNLFVYTSLPEDEIEEKDIKEMLKKLILKHDLVLIDCDLDTPINCFAYVNEVYLVQDMDILTIQPLTEFLEKLKNENILNNKKFNILINKSISVRGVGHKIIISGMSCYSDPKMSQTKQLFDRNIIDRNIVPFDEKAYSKYLESIADCDIKLVGYSKKIMKSLKEVAMKICPHVKFK